MASVGVVGVVGMVSNRPPCSDKQRRGKGISYAPGGATSVAIGTKERERGREQGDERNAKFNDIQCHRNVPNDSALHSLHSVHTQHLFSAASPVTPSPFHHSRTSQRNLLSLVSEPVQPWP